MPLRTGSLQPGSENDATAYRDAGLSRARAAGLRAIDEGDLAIPSYLPHHTVPPIRSWPGPRIVWDLLATRIGPWLAQPGHVPFLVGCDCSVVVGTSQALERAAPGDVHVLYVDGDFDDGAPDPARCQSAAAMAVWLLSRPSPFWTGTPLGSSQITVIGWSRPSQSRDVAVPSVSCSICAGWSACGRAGDLTPCRPMPRSCCISTSMCSPPPLCRRPTSRTRTA